MFQACAGLRPLHVRRGKGAFKEGGALPGLGFDSFLPPLNASFSPSFYLKALLPFVELVLPGCSSLAQDFPRVSEPHHELAFLKLPVFGLQGSFMVQDSYSFPKSSIKVVEQISDFHSGGNWKFVLPGLLNGCGRSTFSFKRCTSGQEHLDSSSA